MRKFSAIVLLNILIVVQLNNVLQFINCNVYSVLNPTQKCDCTVAFFENRKMPNIDVSSITVPNSNFKILEFEELSPSGSSQIKKRLSTSTQNDFYIFKFGILFSNSIYYPPET